MTQELTRNPTYLGCLNHLVSNLLHLLDLLGGHGSLGSEVKPKAVRSHQGTSLVGFPKHRAQGKVQNVGSCVVAHDRSPSGLQRAESAGGEVCKTASHPPIPALPFFPGTRIFSWTHGFLE